MRTILRILAFGSILAIITVISQGVDDFYDLGEVAAVPGSRLILAAVAALGGSLFGLNSWGETLVATESGMASQLIFRPWLIAAAVALLGLAAFLVFIPSADQPASELVAGDCFDEPGTADVLSVTTIPCDEPHDYEVFAVVRFDLAEFTPYPGQSLIGEMAAVDCLERFESYVGSAYATSALDIATLSPTNQSWVEGDRGATCAAYRLDGQKLSRSVRHSGL